MIQALLFVVVAISAYAQSLSESFPAGKGAVYKIKFKDDPTPVHLSLYVAGTRVDSVHIEYQLETKGLLPVQMWQQFEIGVTPKGAEIRKGFVLAKELPKPEIMPADYLKGASGGLQVNDFLFATKEQLARHRIAEEMVEIAAGTTKATHYRTSSNGQTVDYWISDKAKPMGLVMLISKGEKSAHHNYSLELVNMMENVKPKIVPERAVPLTSKGKSFLARPESMR